MFGKFLIEEARGSRKGWVLLLPYMGGSIRSLLRHRQFYREQNLDVVSIDFPWALYSARERWMHYTVRVIKQMSNHFKEAPWIHALSSSSSIGLSAFARNPDLSCKGFIGENGPFFHSRPAFVGLLDYYKKTKNWRAYYFTRFWLQYCWDTQYEKNFSRDLAALTPQKNPFLFIGAENDTLITPQEVRLVASLIPQAEYIEFSHTEHLQGIKKHRALYEQTIKSFFEKASAEHLRQ